MSLAGGHLDWRELLARPSAAADDPRLRLTLIWLGFVVAAAVIFLRVVQLELAHGSAYRAAAAAPLRRERELPGMRGRILARDGTVLAMDQPRISLAVHYRYLETPPNAQWLRSQARLRLPAKERSDARQLAKAEADVLQERAELHGRLAELASVTADDWSTRLARIQRRVEAISESVNRRQQERAAEASEQPASGAPAWDARLREWLGTASPEPRPSPGVITVGEELDYHVVAEGVSLDAMTEVQSHPQQYRGVRIELLRRRAYPQQSLASHTIGHLGNQPPVGLMGAERTYEQFLRGNAGQEVELTDHGGNALSTTRETEPTVGRDLVLTVDLELQRAAEALLDSGISRRLTAPDEAAAEAGGAIVVLNVHSGAVLASASAPRFDPQSFSAATGTQAAGILNDPAHPLLDRVCRMAIPPGSVFKALTAAAMVETGIDPTPSFYCRGYLEQPDRQRCMIFTRYGVGHSDVRLADALAQSCNVYFFHAAGEMGPGPLVDWGRRFGFGRPTGIDLPDEAAGHLSLPGAEGRELGTPTAQAQAMAIGQGTMLTTPLQIACMMAAIANGGKLVTPHVAGSLGLIVGDDATPEQLDEELLQFPPPRPIERLGQNTLAAVREGLERVVSDPQGTGYETVRFEPVAIAGKTGTAETGGGQEDHAWFAGYVPADAPRVAFVIALEHAGSGSTTAGPVARRLVERMHQLGYFTGR